MRAMGADLVEVSEAGESAIGHLEGRASVWVRAVPAADGGELPGGYVARVRFKEVSDHTTTHDLALTVPADRAVVPGRQRLLLLGSRTADVRAFVRRMDVEGWREVAHTERSALHDGDYALSLIDRPAR
jgi:hypothetical protein